MKTGIKAAAIWARVSTSNQRETSLPSQVARCKEELTRHDFTPIHILQADWTSLDLYSCPQFQQLRNLITNGEIQALATLDRDRLEAKGLQRLVFLSECRQSGVKLIICQGPPFLDEPEGQLIELALAIGKERSVLRARKGSKDGLYDRVVKYGKPTTYHRIFGYSWDKDNNRLVPNDDYATLKLIFGLLLNGRGYGFVIRELAHRGIPSPDGQKEWNKTGISNIAHNPVYAGRYFALRKAAVEPKKRKGNTYGNSSIIRKPLDQAHYMPNIKVINPPITWEQRGVILDQLARHQKLSQRSARRNYLLRGFVFCSTHRGKNGKPRCYHGRPKRDGWYYVCPETGGCKCLPGPELEQYVKISIAALLTSQPAQFYEFFNKENVKLTANTLTNELGELQRKKEQIMNKMAKLEDDHYSGNVVPEVYQILLEKYKAERSGLHNRQDEILTRLQDLKRDEEAIRSLSELKRELMARLIGSPRGEQKKRPKCKRVEIEKARTVKMKLDILDDPLEVTDEGCRQIFEMLRLEIKVLTKQEREEAADMYCAYYKIPEARERILKIREFIPELWVGLSIGIPLPRRFNRTPIEGLQAQVPDALKNILRDVVLATPVPG
jgi:hypothetical protein